jgi:hypothetical protein
MKISYVTSYNASDISKWSGTGHHIAKALENPFTKIDRIGDLSIKSEYFFKAKKLLYKTVGKQYLWNREPAIVKSFARQVSKRVCASTDIVFSPDTLTVAYLDSKKPKVIYVDSAFASMVDYYPYFTNLCAETIKNGNVIEQQALDSCSLVLYSSEWAAECAIKYYKIPEHKVKVVPFGANIECNRTFCDIKEL